MMSMITPPVAIAAFAAATLAEAGPMRTALAALRFGWPAFVLPFAFAYNPALLLAGTPGEALLAVQLAASAVMLVTVAIAGYFNKPLGHLSRIAAGIAGGVMILGTAMF